jgi:hypothetical protein
MKRPVNTWSSFIDKNINIPISSEKKNFLPFKMEENPSYFAMFQEAYMESYCLDG